VTAPGTLLRQRLAMTALVVLGLSLLLGYLLTINDLPAAKTCLALQTYCLAALPWSTYKEVKRAWKGEPPNDHEDVVIPWRRVALLWLAAIVGFGLL
jgi:hypothetical protein